MRLLWIEDKEEHIGRFRDLLGSRGYEVVVCGLAEDALARIEHAVAEGPPFQLVLLDIMLPKGEGTRITEGTRPERMGIEILEQMKRRNYAIPVVVVLTAIADSATLASLYQYRFVKGVLKKPVRLDELVEELQKAARPEEPHSESMS